MKEEKRTKIDDNEMCVKGIDEVPMFSWNTKTKEFYVLGHKFDGINSIEDFINYIHNLGKENKSLQSQLKAKEEAIEEAREYMNSEEFFIKMNSNSIQPPPDKYCCQDYFEAKEKLLEILSKGENK